MTGCSTYLLGVKLCRLVPLRVLYKRGSPRGDPCSLPKLPYVPMFPHSLRMFSYCNFSNLFPCSQILANVPLFPSIFCQCSLVPQNPWETLIKWPPVKLSRYLLGIEQKMTELCAFLLIFICNFSIAIKYQLIGFLELISPEELLVPRRGEN